MAKTPEPVVAAEATALAYDLEGTLLEACSCDVLCPCWIGEDPDQGDCKAVNAYKFDRGTIRGVDVSGLSLVLAVHIPGNVLAGNWKVAMFVNDTATDEQMEAIVDAFAGKLGGPLADLGQLVGEVVAVERAPITHKTVGGAGTLEAGDFLHAEMHPYRGPDGTPTTLHNSIFSTVPGSPAYVGVAERNDMNLERFGMSWSFENKNAIQSDWKLQHSAEAA